ncbi:MAG: amidohydrolase family protein [Victivallaceae bacterium]|nr:amidohydrolase family protein [Victivallaceae bacterium]
MPSDALWVDLQVNGHNGVDYSSPELTEDGFLRSVEELFRAGTGIFLPTIVTSAPKLYRRNAALIRRTVERHGLTSLVPGLHLEGPFLTAPGSHNPALLRPVSAEAVRRLMDEADGFLRLLTLAADAPGAEEGIQEALRLGIVPSVGHHLAGYEAIRRAANAGCRVLTHLGNACPNLLDRHENPLLAGLAEERMTAMVIADGFHLPGELIWIICRLKTADRIIVTSDSCSASGYAPGRYRILGNDAVLEPSGRLYNPQKKCLVASVATMTDCMNFLRKLGGFSDAELRKVGRENALKLLNLTTSEPKS